MNVTKKIIKHGHKEPETTIKRFLCYDCNCVFECDKEEYTSELHHCAMIHASDCPECGKLAFEKTSLR